MAVMSLAVFAYHAWQDLQSADNLHTLNASYGAFLAVTTLVLAFHLRLSYVSRDGAMLSGTYYAMFEDPGDNALERRK